MLLIISDMLFGIGNKEAQTKPCITQRLLLCNTLRVSITVLAMQNLAVCKIRTTGMKLTGVGAQPPICVASGVRA